MHVWTQLKYLCATYGLSLISEHYNHRMDEAFAGLSGYRCIVDDEVIYDKDEAQHVKHVQEFLQQCAEKKIMLNVDKWQYPKAKVDFAGFTLSAKGYCIDKSINEAISNFPIPTNRTDLCVFFGLANQLSASSVSCWITSTMHYSLCWVLRMNSFGRQF